MNRAPGREPAPALLPVSERQAALERRYPVWVPRRLDQQLDSAADEFPDTPYVITDERSWTYREIRDWSIRLAAGLVGAGVAPGEHVAMIMANYPEFVALRYAISRVGAVCVPVNTLNRRSELGYVLRQSEAVLLVTMDRFRGNDYVGALDELAPGWERAGGGANLPDLRGVIVFPTAADGGRAGARTLAELEVSGVTELADVGVGADATADILYTSGTTGEPKGVLLTHDMLLRSAYGSAFARAFQTGRRVLFSLPMYHVFGYVEGMLSVTFVGGAIIPQLAFDPVATLAAIGRHRADDGLFVPTMSLALLDELEREPRDLSPLTSMMPSGGVTPSGFWQRFDAAFGPLETTTGYGMSESTATTTLTLPGGRPELRETTHGYMRVVGVAGDASLGNRLVVYRIVDQFTGESLPDGEIGELVGKGPGVTAGYWHKPEETAAAIDAQGWLHTGDLGRMDGDLVTLVGRIKDTYRCGGEQVMPKEIEDVLGTHPSVAQALVVPMPDPRMGEVGVAWIVPTLGARVDAEEFIDWCAERLARFKVPRYVLSIAATDIPVTPSGRPRKFLLSERAMAVLSASSEATQRS